MASYRVFFYVYFQYKHQSVQKYKKKSIFLPFRGSGAKIRFLSSENWGRILGWSEFYTWMLGWVSVAKREKRFLRLLQHLQKLSKSNPNLTQLKETIGTIIVLLMSTTNTIQNLSNVSWVSNLSKPFSNIWKLFGYSKSEIQVIIDQLREVKNLASFNVQN